MDTRQDGGKPRSGPKKLAGGDPASGRLLPQHVEDLAKSGLSEQTMAAAAWSVASPDEVEGLLGWNSRWARHGPFLDFPYPDRAGRPSGYHRLKPDRPRKVNGKVVKYESPRNTPNRAYFPPGTLAALADPAAPLLLTEGEKKSLKADQEGFPCVGLVGVWGWQKGRKPDDDGRKVGPRSLIDDLASIPWTHRPVYVVFDSDAADNPKVRLAEWCLAVVLLDLNAVVRVVRIPPGPPARGGKPTKQGLDDFLVAHGPDALRKLLADAKPAAPPEEAPDWEPPTALGALPAAPPFPAGDVFPEALAGFAAAAARAVGCPVDYLGLPMVAVACGAIGASRALSVKRGWEQRALVYGAIVGAPGDAKTPALSAVSRPVHEAQQRRR